MKRMVTCLLGLLAIFLCLVGSAESNVWYKENNNIVAIRAISFEVSTPVPTSTTNPLKNFSDTFLFADLSDNDILAISEAVAAEMQKRGIYPFIELKKGDKGQDVILIQTYLSDLGYLVNLPSGIFDNNTQSAMKAMEKINSLKQDGIASIEEQEMLSKGSIEPKPTPTPRPTPRPTNTPTPTKTPKPTPTPYREPTYALEQTFYADWGTSYGTPWFQTQVKNTSSKLTIDGYTLVYYCTDVYGNNIEPHGFADIYQYEIINQKIGPGKKVYSTKVKIYGCDDAQRVNIAICKIHFTNGKTVDIPEISWSYMWLDY